MYLHIKVRVLSYGEKPYNKLLHSDSVQLSRFLLKEKAAKTAPTYSPVSKALGIHHYESIYPISSAIVPGRVRS